MCDQGSFVIEASQVLAVNTPGGKATGQLAGIAQSKFSKLKCFSICVSFLIKSHMALL